MERTVLLVLALLWLSAISNLHAQCIGTTITARACAGDTFVAYHNSSCNGCTYNWLNPLYPSTADTAFYASPAPLGYAIEAQLFPVVLEVTDNVNSCVYQEYKDVYIVQRQPFVVQDLDGPWAGDTSGIYRYVLPHHWQPFPMYEQTVIWGVDNGTILNTVTSGTTGPTLPFPTRYDTIFVKWGANGNPKVRGEVQTWDETNINSAGAQSVMCPDSFFYDMGLPALVISGNAYNCTADTLPYSVPNHPTATFNWIVSGGTVISGQGTNNVQVAWAAPFSGGTLQVTRSLGNNTASSPIFNVAVPTYPTGFLGPDLQLCDNDTAFLDATGAFGQQYIWSTGSIAPTTYLVNIPATIYVSVWDTFCNVSSLDTINITYDPNPNLNLGPDIDLCDGDSIYVDAGFGYSSYLWSNNSVLQGLWGYGPGSIWAQVWDANGCTARDTVQINSLPIPQVDLGADTIMCADTTITLIADPGVIAFYLWNYGQSAQSITATQGGIYSVTVTDLNGCDDVDSINITAVNDCVFPGDADYDGLADNNDVLAIGVAYGSIGPPRSNPALTWYGQAAANWTGNLPLPSTANYKQVDTNGDGLINDNDTLAIFLNYGNTHNKANLVQTGGVTLQIQAEFDSVAAGDTAIYSIRLGDSLNLADSVYGIAFTINYDTSIADTHGLYFANYDDCWFAPPGNQVSFTKDLYPAPMADVAVVRKTGSDTSGMGEVCRIGIVTIENISGKKNLLAKAMTVSLTDITFINSELTRLAVGGSTDSTIVVANELNITNPIESLKMYPVPAQEAVYLQWKGSGVEFVEIFDLNGMLLRNVKWNGVERGRLDVADLPGGVYILRVHGTDADASLKLPVLRR